MKLVIANFKMNPRTVREAVRLGRAYDKKGVVIAPPFVFLSAVGNALKRAALGAQDLFWAKEGAWTGETSAPELKSLGVEYAIVGHSERRKLGETDEVVGKKVAAALNAGLKVILCVGENWAVRRKEKRAAYDFVKKQIIEDISATKNHKLPTKNLIIAYEPVWAIGTKKNDAPKDAAEMAFFIKELLAARCSLLTTRVLYGGSAAKRNAAAFLKRPEIDGLLVGGASLRPTEFKKIVKIAEN